MTAKNSAGDLFRLLESEEIRFFTGVPDSTLREFCGHISVHVPEGQHIVAANEGGAIALAAGYHLATGKMPLVYMQNSGLGNATNPLLSLTDTEVYSIPMLLLVGWRGKPGEKDEPQHIKQGRIQNRLMEAMELEYLVLEDGLGADIRDLIRYGHDNSCPVALVCPKGFWRKDRRQNTERAAYEMTRETAMEIVSEVYQNSAFVSTTGRASRELYEIRDRRSEGHQRDFLTVGSMGHCSQIALGLSLFCDKHVVCFDGDGALLMHLGSLPIIGARKPRGFLHILLNNGVYESVGGQKTVAFSFDFAEIARSFGYERTALIDTAGQLRATLAEYQQTDELSFIEIRVRAESRKELGRPRETPAENKVRFMAYISG